MQILLRITMRQRVVPLPVPEGGPDGSERIARQKSPDTMATIAALQINMMGRGVCAAKDCYGM
jgi:hypothetical protein